jgi:hypothetical protein
LLSFFLTWSPFWQNLDQNAVRQLEMETRTIPLYSPEQMLLLIISFCLIWGIGAAFFLTCHEWPAK